MLSYLKVLLVALLGALAAAVLWVLGAFVLPIAIPMLTSRFSHSGSIGVAGAFITSDSILLAAAIGFAVAGTWAFRRFVQAEKKRGR